MASELFTTQELQRIFEVAVEVPCADRGRVLDAMCRGRPELRHEVETLLSTAERAARSDSLGPIDRRYLAAAIREFASSEPGSTGPAAAPPERTLDESAPATVRVVQSSSPIAPEPGR